MTKLLSAVLSCSISCGVLAQGTNRITPIDTVNTNRPVKVFILSGQSNMVGYNNVREYRQGKTAFPDDFRNQPDILFWREKKKSWTPLRIGDSNGSNPNGFGPEIGFAHDLAPLLHDEQIAIIKCAAGSTGIARSSDYNDYIPSLKNYNDHGRNWHAPSEGKEAGLLYQQLLKEVNHALAALEKNGRKYELSAFLWMQGEHEAGISPTMAGDYETLLKSLIKSIRTDLKAPELPVAIGETDSQRWRYGTIVNDAQNKICREDGHAVLVKTAALTRNGSGGTAHYDADGMLELGRRFSAAIHQLLLQNKAPARVLQ